MTLVLLGADLVGHGFIDERILVIVEHPAHLDHHFLVGHPEFGRDCADFAMFGVVSSALRHMVQAIDRIQRSNFF